MSELPPPLPEKRVATPGEAVWGSAPPPPGEEPQHAGLLRRLLAGLVDVGLGLVLIGIAVYAVVPEIENDRITTEQAEAVALTTILSASVWLNYMIFSEWRWGRTLGKLALGTRVVRVAGDEMTWNAALVRNLLLLPDLLAIFVTVPFSERHQRLGDRAARTVVLRWRETERAALVSGSPAAPNLTATWGGARVLAGLGLLLAVTVLAAAIAAAFDPDLEALAVVLALQAALAAGMVAVPFAVALADGRSKATALGLGPALRAPVSTAAIAYGIYLACAVVISLVLSPQQEDIARELGVDEGTLGAIAAFVLIVIAAPVAEEVFFRGFMFGGIRSHGSFVVAALVSAAVWGLFHYTGSDSWPVVLQLTVFGVILAWVYERTGSIRPAIALHMLNNAIAFAVLVWG